MTEIQVGTCTDRAEGAESRSGDVACGDWSEVVGSGQSRRGSERSGASGGGIQTQKDDSDRVHVTIERSDSLVLPPIDAAEKHEYDTAAARGAGVEETIMTLITSQSEMTSPSDVINDACSDAGNDMSFKTPPRSPTLEAEARRIDQR